MSSVGPVSKRTAISWLTSDNHVDVVNAVISVALYSEDRDWAASIVNEHLGHADCDVVAAAIISVGHCARIDGKCDVDAVRPYFERYVEDERFSGRVYDALDDVEVFTGITRRDLGIDL